MPKATAYKFEKSLKTAEDIRQEKKGQEKLGLKKAGQKETGLANTEQKETGQEKNSQGKTKQKETKQERTSLKEQTNKALSSIKMSSTGLSNTEMSSTEISSAGISTTVMSNKTPADKGLNNKELGKKTLGWPLIFSFSILIIFIGGAIFANFIAPHAPDTINLGNRLAGFSSDHLLGTDHLGRDVLSRLIYGARASLGSVAIIAVLIVITGFITGGLAAYLGGWVDTLIMRICELFMTFQTFILALFLVAVLGRGLGNVIIAIVLTHWAWYSRIVRSMVLNIKNRDYILAARVAGGSKFKVFIRHIAVPVLAQLLILASLDLGHMMLHVSGLSFLGLGIQPPTPEWGVMISDARSLVWTNPILIILPGFMIFLTVLSFNIPGDYLRDRLDPSLNQDKRRQGEE